MFPAQDFFVPNENFTKWLDGCLHLRYRKIFDVGAGTGLLTKTMQDMGIDAHGFDIIEREKYHTEITVASEDLIRKLVSSDSESCLMIARPCHSPHIRNYFYNHLMRHRNLFAYYIGLERNVDEDLRGYSFKKVCHNVGADGENVYQVFGTNLDTETFYHLICWAGRWTVEDGYFVSNWGKRLPYNEEIIETAYENVLDINQYAPDPKEILDEYADCGWIDRQGRVYRIPYTRHDTFIYEFLLMDTDVVDGWVHVWPADKVDFEHERYCVESKSFNSECKEINKAQIKALKKEFGIKHKKDFTKELPARKAY